MADQQEQFPTDLAQGQYVAQPVPNQTPPPVYQTATPANPNAPAPGYYQQPVQQAYVQQGVVDGGFQQGYQQQQQYVPQPNQGYQQQYVQQPNPNQGYPQPYQGTPATVVIHQQGAGEFVPDYCFLSWFACLCCCWPIGCCAIMQSQSVQSRLAAGDVAGARVASASARQLSIGSVVFGMIVFGAVIAMAASGVFVTSTTYYYYSYGR